MILPKIDLLLFLCVMMYSYHLLVLSLASFVVQSSAEVGHGWHKDVDWKTLEDGKAEAAARSVSEGR